MTDSQSLARGALADGLLLAVRSHDDPGAISALHDLIGDLGPLVDGPDAGPFYGAPAVAYVLHAAAGGFDRARMQLDEIVDRITRERLHSAWQRIGDGRAASFAEYDLLRGLSGLGAFWLARGTRQDALDAVLEYLVALTMPTDVGPGWRVWHRPDDPQIAGLHVNNALAHGIAGPLAVLSLALIRGHQVPGHEPAIRRILDHLDAARRTSDAGEWWARWDGDGCGRPPQPSWCYGTPGMVRAQQLAGIGLGDQARKRDAERVLLDCLHDDAQIAALTELGVCHGVAGLVRVTERVADDADEPGPLRARAALLRSRLIGGDTTTTDAAGLLTGGPGVQLVTENDTQSRWDVCLALF